MSTLKRNQPLFQPGDVIHGMYEITDYISKGGFAQVWQAKTDHSYVDFALKVLHPHHSEGEAKRFDLERDVMRGLNHLNNPRTPRVHWAGKAPHPHQAELELDFIVMDYIDGVTLAEALQRGRDARNHRDGYHVHGLDFEHGHMTYTSFLALMDQILEALIGVHQLGFVHRDLKPSNIMVVKGSSLNVKLIDFGIVKSYSREPEMMKIEGMEGLHHQHLTKKTEFVASPHYAALEQLLDRERVNPKTDLFALGMIAYECLVGEHMYGHACSHDEALTRMGARLTEPFRLPEDVQSLAPRVARLIHSMLGRLPEQRLAIFRDKYGQDLYDLEKDGGSLTRLVRQTFQSLGRDTDVLRESLSSAAPVSPPQGVEEPETMRLSELGEGDTMIRAYDVERQAALYDTPETKKAKIAFMRLDEDFKTTPTGMDAPTREEILSYGAAPYTSTPEPTARLVQAASSIKASKQEERDDGPVEDVSHEHEDDVLQAVHAPPEDAEMPEALIEPVVSARDESHPEPSPVQSTSSSTSEESKSPMLIGVLVLVLLGLVGGLVWQIQKAEPLPDTSAEVVSKDIVEEPKEAPSIEVGPSIDAASLVISESQKQALKSLEHHARTAMPDVDAGVTQKTPKTSKASAPKATERQDSDETKTAAKVDKQEKKVVEQPEKEELKARTVAQNEPEKESPKEEKTQSSPATKPPAKDKKNTPPDFSTFLVETPK